MYTWVRGYMMSMESGDFIEFQWNPRSLSLRKKSDWHKINVAGRDLPVQQFGCGDAREVSFVLEFSQSDNGPGFVQSQFDSLLEMTRPRKFGGAGMKQPPKMILVLGASLTMTGVVIGVEPEYKSLSHDSSYLAHTDTLLPKEGVVKVVFREYL